MNTRILRFAAQTNTATMSRTPAQQLPTVTPRNGACKDGQSQAQGTCNRLLTDELLKAQMYQASITARPDACPAGSLQFILPLAQLLCRLIRCS